MGKKIAVLGAGNVGATIAYTLAISGGATEIVFIDIAREKAIAEAMDIVQGASFCGAVNVFAGDYPDAAGADIVIITAGVARKPGQTRIDLAQINVNILKQIIPQIVKNAPDALYIVVSNPVDILTYTFLKVSGLPEKQVIGSGTMLDSARLRAFLSERVNLAAENIHGYVLGEHGDTSMVPWSIVTISGMSMETYLKTVEGRDDEYIKSMFAAVEEDVQKSGAKVIAGKGATYYAIALSVRRIVECVSRPTGTALTVSSMMHGRYGLEDVCLSLPYVISSNGIMSDINPPLLPSEVDALKKSADALKAVINSIEI